MGDPGFNSWHGREIFLFPKSPSNLIVSGYRGCCPGVRWPWHAVDHLSPSNAEVQIETVPPYLLYVLMAGRVIFTSAFSRLIQTRNM
jgi:hypothetical protein